MRGMKRRMKIAEWKLLIKQRVESGKTITTWCEEQGIPRRIYHYWQNRVCEEVISNTALDYEYVPGIVSVDSSTLATDIIRPDTPSFAKIPFKSLPQAETAVTAGGLAMKVWIGGAECEIFGGADIDVIERVLLTLGKI